MKLLFLGTRGGIEERSKLHYMHSSLFISYYSASIMIDYGSDWQNQVFEINPDALFITHFHPDHFGGLVHGAPCPVYATSITWSKGTSYSINQKYIIQEGDIVKIGKILIQAFGVEHSIHAPAVGYKISAGKKIIFYVPDLISIKREEEALSDVDIYIGDGAIIKRRILMRKKDSFIVGHVPISDQMSWCKKYGIKKAIITHCGREIVMGNKEKIIKELQKIAQTNNVEIILAYDGMKITT